MEFSALYSILEKNKYRVFSYEDLLSFFPKEGRGNLKKLLYRWKERGVVAALKRGLYELIYPGDFDIPDMYIANRLYEPSYVSLETALSYFGVIPEVAMAVTSITTKPTRRFKNKHGLFLYRTVKPEAFTGYYLERSAGYDIRIAEPEKALADFIHLKTYRSKKVSLKDERLDRSAIGKMRRKKLDKYCSIYRIDAGIIYADI